MSTQANGAFHITFHRHINVFRAESPFLKFHHRKAHHDFRAADHVNAGPWVAGGDDRAVVVFSASRAWFAASQFPGAIEVGADEDGWVVMEIPMADEEAFAAMLLEYGPDAVVRSPASLRDAVVTRLEALLG